MSDRGNGVGALALGIVALVAILGALAWQLRPIESAPIAVGAPEEPNRQATSPASDTPALARTPNSRETTARAEPPVPGVRTEIQFTWIDDGSPVRESGLAWGLVEQGELSQNAPWSLQDGHCTLLSSDDSTITVDLRHVELEGVGRRGVVPARLDLLPGGVAEARVIRDASRGRVSVRQAGSMTHARGLRLFSSPTGVKSEEPTLVADGLTSPFHWSNSWEHGFYLIESGKQRTGRFSGPLDGAEVELLLPPVTTIVVERTSSSRSVRIDFRTTPRRPWVSASEVAHDHWELSSGRRDLAIVDRSTDQILAVVPNAILPPGDRISVDLDDALYAADNPSSVSVFVRQVPAGLRDSLRITLEPIDAVGSIDKSPRKLVLRSSDIDDDTLEPDVLHFVHSELAPGTWRVGLSGLATNWTVDAAPGAPLLLDVALPSIASAALCLIDGSTGEQIEGAHSIQVFQSTRDELPVLSSSGLIWAGAQTAVARCEGSMPVLQIPLWVRVVVPGYAPTEQVFDIASGENELGVVLSRIEPMSIALPWPNDLARPGADSASVRARFPIKGVGEPSPWQTVRGQIQTSRDGFIWTGPLPSERPLFVELDQLYGGSHPAAVVEIPSDPHGAFFDARSLAGH